jgi:hypothetical protein
MHDSTALVAINIAPSLFHTRRDAWMNLENLPASMSHHMPLTCETNWGCIIDTDGYSQLSVSDFLESWLSGASRGLLL